MKKYTIGLITGALLAISAMMFMGAQNKNLGVITADSITLVGELGETVIIGGAIGLFNTDDTQTLLISNTDNGGGAISTCNADGKETVYLGNGEGGVGILKTFNADGKETVYLGDGNLHTYNADGKETAYLGTGTEGFGFLKTSNNHGVMTGYFGTDNTNDGVVVLFDRYGDEGWGEDGKQ
jgi:hypothetical protein